MGDKNIELMVDRLEPILDGVITTSVGDKRAVDALDLADRVAEVVDVRVLTGETVESALDMARAEAGRDGAVLVTGSLYLVGAVRDILR
jgi:dihydrofolate synthase/folylpolyglutamate synthase